MVDNMCWTEVWWQRVKYTFRKQVNILLLKKLQTVTFLLPSWWKRIISFFFNIEYKYPNNFEYVLKEIVNVNFQFLRNDENLFYYIFTNSNICI